MAISERLKSLRLKSNKTLEEVGKLIGATKQTLYKYENGIITNIPIDKIERLADIYNVAPSFIMGWDVERTGTGYIVNDGEDEVNIELLDVTKDLTDTQIRELINFAKFIKQKETTDGEED